MEFVHIFLTRLLDITKSLEFFAPLLIVCMVAEKIWARYPVSIARMAFNIGYAILAFTIASFLVQPVVNKFNSLIPTSLMHLHPQNYSTAGKLLFWAIYLVLFDFLYYWFHRAQHTFEWMWRYHLLHHSDENISSASFARHHWAEEIWRWSFITAPLLLLYGRLESVPYAFTAVVAFCAVLMHLNTPLRLGPFERWIVTPTYHRIHHSIEKKHYNRNFAAFFQIWDVLFKSRYLAEKGEFPKTGVSNFNEKYFPALLLPIPLIPKNAQFRKTEATLPVSEH